MLCLFEVIKINNLLNFDLNVLIKESEQEGFRFLRRLDEDYKNQTNTFNSLGEGLYGIINNDGVILAIGGLNIDPYTSDQRIGRVRRFYVSRNYRRNGIGRLLLNKIIAEAENHFNILVLHTDTEQGDWFYTSLGFEKTPLNPNASHYLRLKA